MSDNTNINSGGFVTYENRPTRRITIHRDECNRIRMNGGIQNHNQGGYEHFQTHQEAENYASSFNGLTMRDCFFCLCT